MSLEPSSQTNNFRNRATRRLRLRLLKPSDLPSHPSLASTQGDRSNAPDLREFVREVLTEAVDFSDSVIPSTFQTKTSSKKSSPSTANVKLLGSDLIKGESWFARQSIHENAPLEGSASWDEFEQGIYDNHSQNEMAYTPTIYDAHKVLDWSEQIKERQDDFGVEFEEVAMEIFEMCHEMPMPLNNRCFSTLVIRAFTRAGAFVVAQVPVNLKKVPNAIYTNGENRKKSADAKKRSKVQVGQYTSVERVFEQDDGNVMWEMAVASDAGGWLPMGLQKMGVPGAIAKDVGFFMKWTAGRRRTGPSGHGKAEELNGTGQSNGDPVIPAASTNDQS